MNFEDWWQKIRKECAFPSIALNNKQTMEFIKGIARLAYNEQPHQRPAGADENEQGRRNPRRE